MAVPSDSAEVFDLGTMPLPWKNQSPLLPKTKKQALRAENRIRLAESAEWRERTPHTHPTPSPLPLRRQQFGWLLGNDDPVAMEPHDARGERTDTTQERPSNCGISAEDWHFSVPRSSRRLNPFEERAGPRFSPAASTGQDHMKTTTTTLSEGRSFSWLQKNRSIFDKQEPTYRPELLGASSFGTPKIRLHPSGFNGYERHEAPKPASAYVECGEPAIIDDDASKTDDLLGVQKAQHSPPDGIIQIRPNYRLNLLALDTRNVESTKALLRLKSLGAVQVMTYEPPAPSAYVGVIRGVSTEIADAELCAALRENAPVIEVRRLGTSEAVKITFASGATCEHSSHTWKNHGNVRSVTTSGILQVPALKRRAVADVEANRTSARAKQNNLSARTAASAMTPPQFRALVGDPDIIYTTPPPYVPPLNIIESVPALKSKRNTPQPVVWSLVEDHVETSFAGWLRVCTGGSVLHSRKSSTAAMCIPELNMTESRKLSFYTTSTTAELLQRASASLLHRLRTGCAFTAKALHRINSAIDPLCPTCDVLEDFDHLLWDCPTTPASHVPLQRKFFFPRVRPGPLLNHSLVSSHSYRIIRPPINPSTRP
ncbi:hypothetical protein HPB47_001022 [Ixodes persulcatus]|uniref:Uncharacterized protein n=1 Tax=Ixodes persulcatus TaxID=34615 RepID=A0AC60PRG0_IXOPE|nr:hypothetical protein HPB47_001022 [Ixodes persulcatus]